MRPFSTAFAIVLLAASFTAAGQGVPPGITMHQLQAGALDAVGWTAARSTAGHFSARLPCLFNDFTTQVQEPGPVLKSYTLGCRRSDQRKFSATRIVYKEGARMGEEYFAKIRSGDGLPGTMRVTALDFKGFKALDLVDTNRSRCAFMRYVLVNGDMVALVTEAPRAACEGLEELSDKFFASIDFDAQ